MQLAVGDAKFLVTTALLTERILQMSWWCLMFFADLFAARDWPMALLTIVAIGSLVHFLITRYSQDSERAATFANNDEYSDDDDE